ncbi:MAG: SRPBCC family protein [Acidimicrobiales bacterium]|jgi:choline monooxygenase
MTTSDDPPVLAAGIAASAYIDPDRFEAERRTVFAREWIAVGDAGRLDAYGSYLATAVAGYPIVVLNDAGRLRAFHNVCRHRSGPLVWDGEGVCRSLVCRYHGWSYNLQGELLSARDFGADVPAGDFSLAGASVDAWRGLLFVNPDGEAPPLSDWLGAVVARCAPFDMENLVVFHRSGHDLAANWKVYAENYQEGYHIPLVHPGLHRQIDSSRYKVELAGPVAFHSAPARDGSITSGAWLWRFPGFALNLYHQGMSLESYWPTGPTSTRVEYTFFAAPGVPDDEARATVENSERVLDEDRVICEAVQRNLASGLSRAPVLSPRHEDGVALVHQLVERALA